MVSEGGEGLDDGVEAGVGLDAAPVGKYADDAGAEAVGDVEGAVGEAGLVVEGVLGVKGVLLKAGVDGRSAGQHALQNGRGDADDLHTLGIAKVLGELQFVVGQVHDIFAENDAEFGTGHADGGHGFEGGSEVRREFVGDGRDGNA